MQVRVEIDNGGKGSRDGQGVGLKYPVMGQDKMERVK